MVVLMVLKYFVKNIEELGCTDEFREYIEVFHELEKILESSHLKFFGSLFQVDLILKIKLSY